MVAMGYSQKSLASKMGVSKNTLNATINGKRQINASEINKVCKLLNIDNDIEKVDIFLRDTSHFRDNNGDEAS